MAKFQAQSGAQNGQKQAGLKQVEKTVAENNKKFLAEIGQLAGQLEQQSKSPSVQQNARQIKQFAQQVEANEQSEQRV